MSKGLVDITGMIPIYYFKIPILIKIGIVLVSNRLQSIDFHCSVDEHFHN